MVINTDDLKHILFLTTGQVLLVCRTERDLATDTCVLKACNHKTYGFRNAETKLRLGYEATHYSCTCRS